MQPLCGRILKPCRWNAFQAALTSSLAAIPVSHFRQQVADKEKTIPGTSGPTSKTSLMQLDLFDASSKTSKDTSASDSEKSSRIWKDLVIQRRGECSQRLKSARLIRENESTSWATPNTMDHLPQRSVEAMKVHCRRGGRKNQIRPDNLREQVSPSMVQAVNEARAENNGCTVGELDPPAATIQPQTWPTPTASDGPNMIGSKEAAAKENERTQGGVRLSGAVPLEQWPTPRASEYKDCGPVGSKSQLHMEKRSYLCAKVKDQKRPAGQLNPNWVEQLMGVPPGWTALDGTSNEWHYGWHDGSWEDGIPRVIEGCPDRVDRIRLLGNGVVPQMAAKAWRVLEEQLDRS